MNRRNFIKSVIAPIVIAGSGAKLVSDSLFIPHPAQLKFFNIPVATDWNMPLNQMMFINPALNCRITNIGVE